QLQRLCSPSQSARSHGDENRPERSAYAPVSPRIGFRRRVFPRLPQVSPDVYGIKIALVLKQCPWRCGQRHYAVIMRLTPREACVHAIVHGIRQPPALAPCWCRRRWWEQLILWIEVPMEHANHPPTGLPLQKTTRRSLIGGECV